MRPGEPELSEAFSEQGYWWVDGDQEHYVGGLLKYDPQEGLFLETWGSILRTGFPKDVITTIRGMTEKGRNVTLLVH
jgi:hypothetical protein